MAEAAYALGRGALWSVLDNLAQQLLSFLVFLVLARLIAPQDFGLLAIAHLVVTFFRQTVLDAIVHPVARSATPTDAGYARAFSVCLLVSLLMATFMLVSASALARTYGQPELERVLTWMSPVVVFSGLAAVFETRLIRQMQFRPLAIRSIASVSLGGVAGVALAVQGMGVMALVVQQLITSGVGLALLLAQSSWWPQRVRPGTPWGNHLRDASHVSLTGLFGFLSSQGDTVLVSVLMGPYATGIYSFAKRLTSAIYLVIASSLIKLAIPAFAATRDQPGALQTSYLHLLGLTFFLMAPLLTGLSVLAPSLITVCFGQVWAAAAPVVALLSGMYLLLAFNQLNDYLFFATGASALPLKRTLLQIALALSLGWLGASRGLVGISAGFFTAAVLVWPWGQRLANARMACGLTPWMHSVQAPALASLAMGLSVIALQASWPAGPWMLASCVALGAGVFLLAHRLAVRFSEEAHDALADLLRIGKTRSTGVL